MNYNESDFKTLVPANYDYWCKADVWTIQRGIFLLIGIEDVSISIHRDYDELNCINVSDAWNMIQIAESSLEAGVLIPHKLNPDEPLESLVLPSVFIAWARLKGYSIPEQLEKIDLALTPSVVNNQSDIRADDKPKSFSGIYAQRDNDFKAWINETNPSLDDMKIADIQKALIARDKEYKARDNQYKQLFTSGFKDWWKQQTIHKGRAGRKKKVIK